MIAIPATPAPTPIPASAPVERLGAAGCTTYWIAKTMFMIAEVGVSDDVLEAALGAVGATGTAGGPK
jgi:hypothetical protein